MTFSNWTETLIEELRIGLSEVDDETIGLLIKDIQKAHAVYCDGKGRSGLMISSFAMRLSQMQKVSYVPWGATTPAITEGDLLIISSGSGETEDLVVHARKAKEVGARIALITTDVHSTIAGLADYNIRIRGGSKHAGAEETMQPMGSLFEQCVLLLLDGIVMKLMEVSGIEESRMRALHNNLE